MISKKFRDFFLKNHSANCRPEELYKNYKYYFDKYSVKKSFSNVENLGDCLWYLKKFIDENKPEDIVKYIHNDEEFVEKSVEYKTIFLMHRVALLEMYYEQYQTSAHWAKKTLEMINYFHPYLNNAGKQEMIKNNKIYKDCESIFKEYYKYFNPETHRGVIFKWEHELHKTH